MLILTCPRNGHRSYQGFSNPSLADLIFDMREHDWKPWRAIFSKAFSAEHVVSLIPDMVDETMVYSETLKKFAEQKQMFQLDLITLRFTIDVIGKTILYVENPAVYFSLRGQQLTM